jgi:tripartite-type tricarboxylate transporter receptor subunit TctC
MTQSVTRRRALQVSVAAAAGAFLPRVFAQADGSVKLIVTFPPGGSTDITARIVQPRLAERIGRTVVVENKPGAASQVGTQFVAKAAPDGNTLLVCFDSHAINPLVKKNLPYDTFKDFVGVTLAVRFPLVIGASLATPGKDLREFLAAAKANPGKYSYASTGIGSMNHLVAEDIKRRAGVDYLHVPYGGGGPAVQAVLGNNVNLTLLSYAALKGNISGGKIKPLAVTGASRLADLPDTPTVAELGFPGFEAYSWIGIFVPAATPAPTVKKMSEDFQAALKHPDVSKRLTDAGFEVMATDGPAVDRYARTQHDRWAEFIKTTGLKVEE